METAKTIEEAEAFFLRNHKDDLKCVKPDGTEKVCECFADADEFFSE